MKKKNCVLLSRKEVLVMMNKEMINRVKTAGEYQKKAIRALFPEEMGEHLDVIEKELKVMAMEMMAELLKGCMESGVFNEQPSQEQASKVKKVDIV